MNSPYVEVTRRSWFDRLAGSIKGIFTGFILFIASFGVLYWNEGRSNMAETAAQAVPIKADSPDMAQEGKLVGATGVLSASDKIGDNLYLLPGEYLTVSRKVEVYAWVEKSESKTEEKLGGTEETTTTYTYAKDWVSDAASSGSFKQAEGHDNVEKTIDDETVNAIDAKVGSLSVDLARLSLPGSEDISLSETTVALENAGNAVLGSSKYIYVSTGWGSLSSPEIGDMRISYSAVPSGQDLTVMGKLEKGKLTPFLNDDKKTLYRAFTGTLEDAVATLNQEHTTMTWILRLVGFLMMWGGLSAIFAIFSTVFAVIPFLGKVTGALIQAVTFVVALVLSILTILVSMLFHNIYAVVAIVVLAIGFGIYWYKMRKKNPETPAPAAV